MFLMVGLDAFVLLFGCSIDSFKILISRTVCAPELATNIEKTAFPAITEPENVICRKWDSIKTCEIHCNLQCTRRSGAPEHFRVHHKQYSTRSELSFFDNRLHVSYDRDKGPVHLRSFLLARSLSRVLHMTDRREYVKALRAFARSHGVDQVRDDAGQGIICWGQLA